MKLLIDTYKKTGTIGHAYCVVGDRHYLFSKISDFFKKHFKISTVGNPDVWMEHYDLLSIDNSRGLSEMQNKRPLGERKIFIISIVGATVEAQNALLKMLEEPKELTHFFIIVRSPDVFLPTVKSRMIFINDEEEISDFTLAKEFLKKNPKERIESFEEIIENKDREAFIKFLDNLLVFIKEDKNQTLKEKAFVLGEISKSRDYAHDRSPNIKMMLEHLSLIIPVKK